MDSDIIDSMWIRTHHTLRRMPTAALFFDSIAGAVRHKCGPVFRYPCGQVNLVNDL